jgi:hypothetical protein
MRMSVRINSSALAAFRRTTSVAATDYFCKKATSRLEANAQEMKSTLLTMAATMNKSVALQGAARRFALTRLLLQRTRPSRRQARLYPIELLQQHHD